MLTISCLCLSMWSSGNGAEMSPLRLISTMIKSKDDVRIIKEDFARHMMLALRFLFAQATNNWSDVRSRPVLEAHASGRTLRTFGLATLYEIRRPHDAMRWPDLKGIVWAMESADAVSYTFPFEQHLQRAVGSLNCPCCHPQPGAYPGERCWPYVRNGYFDTTGNIM